MHRINLGFLKEPRGEAHEARVIESEDAHFSLMSACYEKVAQARKAESPNVTRTPSTTLDIGYWVLASSDVLVTPSRDKEVITPVWKIQLAPSSMLTIDFVSDVMYDERLVHNKFDWQPGKGQVDITKSQRTSYAQNPMDLRNRVTIHPASVSVDEINELTAWVETLPII